MKTQISFVFFYLLTAVQGYKVLIVHPFTTYSISFLGDGYARELLRKGHEVTYITSYPMKYSHENLTMVDVSSMHDEISDDFVNMDAFLEVEEGGQDVEGLFHSVEEVYLSIIKNENIRTFIHDPTKNFDVVVALWMYGELFAGFSALYQCPLVWASTIEADASVLRVVDNLANPAYTTTNLSNRTPPFSFRERIAELWLLLETLFALEKSAPKLEQLYKEVFESAAKLRGVTLPPYQELIYNGSLVLANSHPSLNDAPKLPQNAKNIAGYHIDRELKPLPKDLQEILDDAKHGAIYFSLGSYMKSAFLPEQLKIDLLKMFGGLKQTVIWKFEDNLPNLPKNVHIVQWAPQQSILAHPNTKLFITHGGFLSTTETVHFGVPIVAIPLFFDQFLNAKRAVKKGFAVDVKFSVNLANDLRSAINEILGNLKYVEKVKQVSALYRDRPMLPGDELVYWVEHVVRTGGAPHLRSAALLLPWYSRLYLDLLALVVVALLAAALGVKFLFNFLRAKFLAEKLKQS